MDKQQFDHIENRIRKAADEISVPANEAAWEKMQVLLDDEFNKDRRRGGIWWWFSLSMIIIAALGIYFFQSGSSERDHKMSLTKVTPTLSQPVTIGKPAIDAPKGKEIVTPGIGNIEIKEDVTQQKLPNKDKDLTAVKAEDLLNPQRNNSVTANTIHKPVNGKFNADRNTEVNNEITETKKQLSIIKPVHNSSSSLTAKSKKKKLYKSTLNGLANDPIKDEQVVGKTDNNVPIDNTIKTDNIGKTDFIEKAKPSDVDSQNIASTSSISSTSISKLDSSLNLDSISKKTVKLKSNPTYSKGFYIIASIAGDATGTTIKNITTKDIKPVYGIGIGYNFNKRLSVQTGFYAGKRIYTAGPDDYKVTPGSYVAKIISADAECYIYDIPISVRYNVLQRKMYNIYFTTGLSTYILKRETYDMHFFNPSGTYRRMSYTYNNNTDYLSILNFSLGFEHKLSNAFYIQAEPYLKLPLSGVGEGNVKLYSAGLQLGIKYQPIKKKK